MLHAHKAGGLAKKQFVNKGRDILTFTLKHGRAPEKTHEPGFNFFQTPLMQVVFGFQVSKQILFFIIFTQ